MYCVNCGKELDEGALFCWNCGAKLDPEDCINEDGDCLKYESLFTDEDVITNSDAIVKFSGFEVESDTKQDEGTEYVPFVQTENPYSSSDSLQPIGLVTDDNFTTQSDIESYNDVSDLIVDSTINSAMSDYNYGDDMGTSSSNNGSKKSKLLIGILLAIILLLVGMLGGILLTRMKTPSIEPTQEKEHVIQTPEFESEDSPATDAQEEIEEEEASLSNDKFKEVLNGIEGIWTTSENKPYNKYIGLSWEQLVEYTYNNNTGRYDKSVLDQKLGDLKIETISSQEKNNYSVVLPDGRTYYLLQDNLNEGQYSVMLSSLESSSDDDTNMVKYSGTENEIMSMYIEPLVYKRVAKASSVLEDDGGFNYKADNLIDNNLSTAWAEGAEGQGIGEWIEVSYDEDITGALAIYNGYQKNKDVYYWNSRVKEAEIEFSSGEKYKFTLYDDKDGEQTVLFPDLGKTNAFKLTIKSVYEGSKWDETNITEIEAISNYVRGTANREITATKIE